MKPIKKALVVYYSQNYGTLPAVKRELRRNGISASYAQRENNAAIKMLVKEGIDAVIVVGGDGTLLKASHFIEDTPAVLVSSGVRINEAYFGGITKSDMCRKLKLLAEGKYRITPLMRLEASVNGRKLPFKALNEVFAGSEEPYHTARYTIKVNGKSEEQKSSGVIIATPAGSHSWAKSSGGNVVPRTARKIVYVVREPYIGRLTKPTMLKGILEPGKKVTLVSNIWEKHRGIVVIDSYKKEFGFNNGDRLVVKAAKQDLNMIEF